MEDLEDVLRIARVKGKQVLKAEKVIVKPKVVEIDGDYVVSVEKFGVGKSSGVGERTNMKD